MLVSICLAREKRGRGLCRSKGMYGGSTKSLLCVCISRTTTSGGKSLSSDLVLYEQALQNPIGMSLSAAQLPRDVLNRPVTVTPLHQRQNLFREMTALLWSYVLVIGGPLQKERLVLIAPLNVPRRAVRAGTSFHALQPHLNVLVWLLLIKFPEPPNLTGSPALTGCAEDGIKGDGVGR